VVSSINHKDGLFFFFFLFFFSEGLEIHKSAQTEKMKRKQNKANISTKKKIHNNRTKDEE
jgi:hypothetical protein